MLSDIYRSVFIRGNCDGECGMFKITFMGRGTVILIKDYKVMVVNGWGSVWRIRFLEGERLKKWEVKILEYLCLWLCK